MGRVLAAYATLAKRHNVPIEAILEIQRRRASYRLAKMYRGRARRRTIGDKPRALRKKYTVPPRHYAGEGELHSLLREAGLKPAQFCALAGISERSFNRWEGHPIAMWPIQLLYFLVWSKRMAEFLTARGWNPDDYRPKGVTLAPGGRYPRTPEQVRALQKNVAREMEG